MPSHRYPIIAKEGWRLIAILLFLCVAFYYIQPYLIIPTVLVLVFVFFLLRDPHRLIPSAPLGIVSPVHGTVTLIDKYHSERLDKEVSRIRIKMSWLDIYSLRSPIEGKVIEQWATRKNCKEDKRHDFLIHTDEGDEVLTKIRYRNKYCSNVPLMSGQRIGQGKRCGFLCLGAEVDVSISGNISLEVHEGDRVDSGATVLANLIHHKEVSVLKDKEK